MIMEQLIDDKPDLIFLQETWLKSLRSNVTSKIKEYGYYPVHNIRKNREKDIGGGVGVLIKFGVKYDRVKQREYSSFEHKAIRITVNCRSKLLVISIYRVLFISVKVFLEDFVTFLEYLVTLKDNFIISGDINLHMDTDPTYSRKFKEILDTFNLVQHVQLPTHLKGHTLDVIITYNNNPDISNIEAKEYNEISHHYLIGFNVNAIPIMKTEKLICYRNIKGIDLKKFTDDLQRTNEIDQLCSFGDNITNYNRNLQTILDKHAPMKSKTIKISPNAPWFDGEYDNLRKRRRKAEKVYRRTRLKTDKDIYTNLRKETTSLAYKKKCSYYNDKLKDLDSKSLYASISKLLDKEKEKVLPDCESDVELANSFLDYFKEKIENIRSTFKNSDQKHIPYIPFIGSHKLSTFDLATDDEIKDIVSSYGIKSSPDDPLPATVLKSNVNFFIPIWTKLVNMSLEQGSMECLKNAIVTPLIKELDDLMDTSNKKNYRPVSNLLFLAKLVERVVAKRLNQHMSTNNLHTDCAHGYKTDHSPETLLLSAVNDLLQICEKKLPSILMFLDLSAAFDTVDQKKLLNILKEEIGVDGMALNWFNSFLRGRTQKVKIGSSYSKEAILEYGVPQGSVLGPILFNIYIRSLCKYIEKSKFKIFGFADDHQLMKSFLPIFQINALDDELNRCFELIAEWMNTFFLKLNPSKTKILLIVPPSVKNDIVIRGTYINEKCIRFVKSAKNLGVILDEELSFKDQINKVVKSSFMTIRELSSIKQFLTEDQLKSAVCSFIFSRLDYCNSLYYGINSELVAKLQSVQNAAARLTLKKNVFRKSVSDRIRQNHWLRLHERILFKICLTVRKCLNGRAPHSLRSMLKVVSSERTNKLQQLSHSNGFGNRCFARIAPKIWNLLPLKLRVENDVDRFKKSLKTYLFDNSEQLFRKLQEK